MPGANRDTKNGVATRERRFAAAATRSPVAAGERDILWPFVARRRRLQPALAIPQGRELPRFNESSHGRSCLAVRWEDFDSVARHADRHGQSCAGCGQGAAKDRRDQECGGQADDSAAPFATDALTERRSLPYLGEQVIIFPSTAGTLDAGNVVVDQRFKHLLGGPADGLIADPELVDAIPACLPFP
jgi:hypothetical protein